jgi:hypothetical protein
MPLICIQPQNPNYNIHTSQAAKQTQHQHKGEFSEAVESTDTDDKDDCLSWLVVSGRGKKKQTPEPQGANNEKQ